MFRESLAILEARVDNVLGLHTRPVAMILKCTLPAPADVYAARQQFVDLGREREGLDLANAYDFCDAKNILAMLGMAFRKDSILYLVIHGEPEDVTVSMTMILEGLKAAFDPATKETVFSAPGLILREKWPTGLEDAFRLWKMPNE